jgi:hypothetical protein
MLNIQNTEDFFLIIIPDELQVNINENKVNKTQTFLCIEIFH